MIPGNQDEILRGERFQRCCHRFHVPYSLSKTLFFLKLITDPNDAEPLNHSFHVEQEKQFLLVLMVK